MRTDPGADLAGEAAGTAEPPARAATATPSDPGTAANGEKGFLSRHNGRPARCC